MITDGVDGNVSQRRKGAESQRRRNKVLSGSGGGVFAELPGSSLTDADRWTAGNAAAAFSEGEFMAICVGACGSSDA